MGMFHGKEVAWWKGDDNVFLMISAVVVLGALAGIILITMELAEVMGNISRRVHYQECLRKMDKRPAEDAERLCLPLLNPPNNSSSTGA